MVELISRRTLLATTAAASIVGSSRSAVAALPRDLRHGDLIWLREKNKSIIFRVPTGTQIMSTSNMPIMAKKKGFIEPAAWEAGRRAYLASAAAKARDSVWLSNLSVRDFFARYFYDAIPSDFLGDSLDKLGIYVGHVGLVRRTGRHVEIIEAADEISGVTRTEWSKWIDPKYLMWSGRLTGLTPTEIEKVVEIAERQVGKKYDFWNFDLSDASSFYCSKLIWYAVMSATGKSVDGVVEPQRKFWCSPKQLTRSQLVTLMEGEGPY